MSSGATQAEAADAVDGVDADADVPDESYVEFLGDLVADLDSRVEALEEEKERLQETVEQQAQRIDELDERTDIMALVQEADSVSARQRRVALLTNLKRDAEERARAGKKRSATLNQEQAAKALYHPDIHRTTYYTDFETIEEWVGNKNVCRYVSESGGGSHLLLDLTNGDLLDQDLPVDVANEIRGGD